MSNHTRSSTLEHPSDSTATMADEARRLLRLSWEEIESRGLGLIGFTAANLTRSDAVQLGLDFGGRDRSRLDSTVDSVRERYGIGSITRGSHLGNEPFEMPMLPDDPEADQGP
jgi:DNA polymerase-4